MPNAKNSFRGYPTRAVYTLEAESKAKKRSIETAHLDFMALYKFKVGEYVAMPLTLVGPGFACLGCKAVTQHNTH